MAYSWNPVDNYPTASKSGYSVTFTGVASGSSSYGRTWKIVYSTNSNDLTVGSSDDDFDNPTAACVYKNSVTSSTCTFNAVTLTTGRWYFRQMYKSNGGTYANQVNYSPITYVDVGATTYNLRLTRGTGIASYTAYTSESSTYITVQSATYHDFTLPAGGKVYLTNITYSSGYSYPVNCTNLAGTGTFQVIDENGDWDDNEVQISSSGGNRNATLTATEAASITIKLTNSTVDTSGYAKLTFTCTVGSYKSYNRTVKIYNGYSLIGSATLSAYSTSCTVTCSNLATGAEYEACAYLYYGSTLEAISSDRLCYTNYNLNWGVLGAGSIASGQPTSNLTASSWNLYRSYLTDKCRRHSRTYSYSSVSSGSSITASTCRDINTQYYYLYGTYPVNHSYLTSGYTMYASYFNTWMNYMNMNDNTYDS